MAAEKNPVAARFWVAGFNVLCVAPNLARVASATSQFLNLTDCIGSRLAQLQVETAECRMHLSERSSEVLPKISTKLQM